METWAHGQALFDLAGKARPESDRISNIVYLGVNAFDGKRLPKQVLPFDPNDGAAFWWANGRNTIAGNVACENDQYGYRYDSQKRSNFDSNLPVLMPGHLKN